MAKREEAVSRKTSTRWTTNWEVEAKYRGKPVASIKELEALSFPYAHEWAAVTNATKMTAPGKFIMDVNSALVRKGGDKQFPNGLVLTVPKWELAV